MVAKEFGALLIYNEFFYCAGSKNLKNKFLIFNSQRVKWPATKPGPSEVV